MSTCSRIVFYTTSITAIPKVKADHDRIKRILDAKRVEYEEVDLSMYPERREDMLRASGNSKALPQLHVNDNYIGSGDDIQEYEDFGELDQLLYPQDAY